MRRALGLAVICLGCAEIATPGPELCGNNVVEPQVGEDCDLVVDDALGEDLSCGPADGSAQQCRYVCDGAECPRSWACGDDGICRPASGMFEADEDPVAVVDAQEIALRDIQGDEEGELVVRLEGDLFVFVSDDVGYAEQHALSIPNPRGGLAFADFDEDELADLVLPAASRALDATAEPWVHALRSDGERLVSVIVPQTYAQRRIVAVTGVPTAQPGVEVLLRVLTLANGRLQASASEPTCARPTAGASLGLGGTGAVPVPAVGLLFAELRPHAAVAVAGDRDVTLVEVEHTCGPNVCEPRSGAGQEPGGRRGGQPCAVRLSATQVVRMPKAVADPGCLLLDTDGDGDADLVCHVEGGALAVAVADDAAFADGQPAGGLFADLDDLPGLQPRECAPQRRILAARDLVGDSRDDLVTPHGVFEALDGGFRRVFARTLGNGWGEAVVADFDRDGRLELVATVLQQDQGCAPTRLQALEDTGGAYSEVPVRAVSSPQQLRTGDFDGDGIDDVAVIESAPHSVRAAVLFGDTKEALEDKVSVGGFAQVSGLAVVRAREGTEINEERLSDLAIVSEDGEFFTLVTGTTKRSLLSPLAFDGVSGRAPIVTLAGTLGPRAQPQGPPDVLTLAPDRGWLVRDDDVHHGDEPVVVPVDGLPLRIACSTWAVGPARVEGGSLIAGVDGHAPRLSAVEHDCDLVGPAPTLVVGRFEGTRAAPVLTTTAAAVAGNVRAPTRVEVFDFDGSGMPDVVVHFAGPGSLQWLVDPAPGAAVGTMLPLLPELEVLAAAAIDADADDGLELAVMTPDGLRIADYDAARQTALVVSEPAFGLPRAPVAGAFVSLVAGDADGDELTDLAFFVGDGVYLYPALARP
jgi:hypothetical protein